MTFRLEKTLTFNRSHYSSLTPELRRKVIRQITEFDEDWYVDPETKEIRHKTLSWSEKVRQLVWAKRYPVSSLYRWANHVWPDRGLVGLGFPVGHDNTPVEGFPLKYFLRDGFTIPTKDIKYLCDGPLASEGLGKILVPATLGWTRFILYIKKVAPAVSGLITICGALVKWWDEISDVLNKLF